MPANPASRAVYVNTLMLQDVLAEPAGPAYPDNHRGLTPLFWQHVLPHGEAKPDMTARVSIRTDPPQPPAERGLGNGPSGIRVR